MIQWLTPILFLINICSIHSQEYNDQYARKMLSLAAASYGEHPIMCVEKEFPGADYRLISMKVAPCDEQNNTCAVYTAVSSKQKKIFVSFRGTVGDAQLKLETVDSLKPDIDWYQYGLIDSYFYNALEKLWPYVLPALNQSSSKDWDVQFTGYSLGGALATLAAMRTHTVNLRQPQKIHLLTFGEPRVGNPVFSNNVDRVIDDAWRVVHKTDLVPHLPPCKDGGYKRRGCDRSDLRRAYHHGTEVWYNNGMTPASDYKVCTQDDEDADCSDSLGKYDAKDHLHYFGQLVSEYGISGCTAKPTPVSKAAGTILSSISLFFVLILAIFE